MLVAALAAVPVIANVPTILIVAGVSTAVSVPVLARLLPSRQPADRDLLAHWSLPQRLALATVGTLAFASIGSAVAQPLARCAAAMIGTLFLTWAAVDLRTHRLPDRLTRANSVPAGVTCGGVAILNALWVVAASLLGAFGFFIIIEGIRLVQPAGMGLGDVKLALVLGADLGVVAGRPARAVSVLLMALFVALVLSLLIGTAAGMMRSRTIPKTLPPGPGLVAGSWLVATAVLSGAL